MENKISIVLAVAYIADTALEYYLGKSEKVKAGSKLELILNLSRGLLGIILRRKK